MKKVIYVMAVALALGACAGKNEKGEKAKADYDRALADSIEIVKQEIDSCDAQIKINNDRINGLLADFTTVANPREVGSYLIYTPFKERYPLTETGLVARINDNGQFELIAALSGRHFDQVMVQTDDESAESQVVPNDQALNYRNGSFTTVLFTGAEADSIGALIADNELNPITVNYLQGNPVSAWRMPADYAKMISTTYLLYKARREVSRLENRVPMLHEKINLLRSHQDRFADTADNVEDSEK